MRSPGCIQMCRRCQNHPYLGYNTLLPRPRMGLNIPTCMGRRHFVPPCNLRPCPGFRCRGSIHKHHSTSLNDRSRLGIQRIRACCRCCRLCHWHLRRFRWGSHHTLGMLRHILRVGHRRHWRQFARCRWWCVCPWRNMYNCGWLNYN